MWLVMIGYKGGYKAHSFHIREDTAREWARCLEHSGEDASVCFVDNELLDELPDVKENGG